MYEIEVGDRVRRVAVRRIDHRYLVTIDGETWIVDAARIDEQTWSLLVDRESSTSAGTASGNPPPLGGEEPAGRADATRVARSRSYEVTVAADPPSNLRVRVGGVPVDVTLNGRRRWAGRDDQEQGASDPQRIVAPMPGKVVRVLVSQGAQVRVRQPIVVIEAMKMENELRATRDGSVAEVLATEGQSVEAGAVLATIT